MTEEKFNELVAMVKDQGIRLRSVEDFILGRVNQFLELSNDLKARVEHLEEDDIKVMAYLNDTCQLKDREREEARKSAIDISCNHADKNHKQTAILIAGMFSMFIGAVVYFNVQNNDRALDIKKHETQIEGISKTLDKIDTKMDKIMSHIATEEH